MYPSYEKLSRRENRVALTFQPLIRGDKVEELLLHFDHPLTVPACVKLLVRLREDLESSHSEHSHKHDFAQFPVYSYGEMIAVVEKCTCGATRRKLL